VIADRALFSDDFVNPSLLLRWPFA